jgi:hypothetical protein
MTQSVTRLLATGLLLASSALACGKYGPPVRTVPVQAANAAAPAAPAAAEEACEEADEEKKAP